MTVVQKESLVTFRETKEQAPCKRACPAGIDVPRYIRLAADGKFREALAVICEKIPFPSICGRVCFAPCESACNAGLVSDSVAIRALKRFVTEQAEMAKESLPTRLTGKSVGIVGAGPAGLTAAYYSAKRGHRVAVFEALPELGGLMRSKIPDNRLPRNILNTEIEIVISVGVEIKTNTRVDSVDTLFEEGYDAIFLASGHKKQIQVEADTLATSREGVFAGGEIVSGPASVIDAIAAGRLAAISIDKYLGGEGMIDERLAACEETIMPVGFQPVGERNVPRVVPSLRAAKRLKSSDEVEQKLEEETAIKEAKRCLRCDLPIIVDPSLCAGCRTCELRCSLKWEGAFVPAKSRVTILRLVDANHEFDITFSDECDGCGICAKYCPYGALKRGIREEV